MALGGPRPAPPSPQPVDIWFVAMHAWNAALQAVLQATVF